jgi:hypothetical protein
VGEIIKEMGKQMPKAFLRLQVFLATYVAIPAYHFGPTVQTIVLFALGKMGQIVKFSLK